MRILSERQKADMYAIRHHYMFGLNDVAVILNAKFDDIKDAQMGGPIPNEVHQVLSDWIERHEGVAKG